MNAAHMARAAMGLMGPLMKAADIIDEAVGAAARGGLPKETVLAIVEEVMNDIGHDDYVSGMQERISAIYDRHRAAL